MTTPTGDLAGSATIQIQADTDPAMRAINGLARDAGGRLRNLQGQFVASAGGANDTSRSFLGLSNSSDRAGLSLGGLGRGVASMATSLSVVGAAAGTALPLLAGLVATLGNIAPAAAGAATGFVAVAVATNTIKLGMVGVGKSISAAFETGKGSSEKFQKSLEKLSPSARDFVVAVRDSRDSLMTFQQSIQEGLFTGLDDVFKNTASSVLPVLQTNLTTTANILGNMATGAANAASQLAKDGTLGKALGGANQGLNDLRRIPGQLVTGFVQIAAAGTPAFTALTKGAAGAADDISGALTRAFKSGALEDAVRSALNVLKQLGKLASSAFGILQNVLSAAATGGGDLFQVLGTVLNVLEKFTGTAAFRDAIQALVQTMGVLATSVAPLLLSALKVLAPIFTNLAGPIQSLIKALATGLAPIIAALGPVFNVTSKALGTLIFALAPLFPIVGKLIAQLGPILIPILAAVGQVAGALGPIILSLTSVLSGALQPILAVLPSIIQPILDAFFQLLRAVLPILNTLIVALTPVLNELSGTFVELLVALTPVIISLLLLATKILVKLVPVIIPIINLLLKLTLVFSQQLSNVINSVVIPAINAIIALLHGNFSAAFGFAKQAVFNYISIALRLFREFPGKVFSALISLGSKLLSAIGSAFGKMISAIVRKRGDAIREVGKIPGMAAKALSGFGTRFYNAGRSLIQEFISGIGSLGSSVSDAVSDIVSGATSWLPGSPAEVGPLSGKGYTLFRGQSFSEDFARGIQDNSDEVNRAAGGVARSASRGVTTAGATLPLSNMVTTGNQAVVPTPTTIELTLINQGVLGSRVEVLDWLTRAIDELRQQRRLRVNL